MRVQLGKSGSEASITKRAYFKIDFPDQGQEDRGTDQRRLVDEFEDVFQRAVERRLRADVPVVAYLSGGIDSSMVVAMATKVRKQVLPTFTIRIMEPKLDETVPANVVSRHIGTKPVVVNVGPDEVLNTYPALIRAAEGPVIDTSCTALLLLAQSVHAHGYKVALTGEGSDEWLAGYEWFKVHRALSFLDVIPGLPLSMTARRLGLRLSGIPGESLKYMDRLDQAAGGHSAFQDIYGLMSLSRLRFYSARMRETLADHIPYEALEPDLDRLRRWHPLNRSLYWGARVHLPGHLLSLKGDRVAMNSSVETRYPFLDENVFAFLARLHPRWKMRGFQDKYILRLLGERYLPRSIAWGPKGMFRAPLHYFFADQAPAFVDQLLSEQSLRKTGYFDPQAVAYWRDAFKNFTPDSKKRISIELGLVGVVTTQLWHHTFIDSSLADLPAFSGQEARTRVGPLTPAVVA
jgi:asparagine synthase (glutamine-hydrolysing)